MSLKMLSLLSSYPIQCPLTCERIWSLNWSIFRIQHVLVKCWPRIPEILTLPLPWVWSETEVNFRTNVCTPDQGSDDVDSALISTWEKNNENDSRKSSSYEVLYTRDKNGQFSWKRYMSFGSWLISWLLVYRKLLKSITTLPFALQQMCKSLDRACKCYIRRGCRSPPQLMWTPQHHCPSSSWWRGRRYIKN